MNQSYNVVALLGDGAATGGMVYEGLNDAAVSNEPMIVILNDNAMSIDRNVGGMAAHLSALRTKEKYLGMKRKYRSVLSKIPGGEPVLRFTRGVKDRLRRMLIPTTVFENMGFTYLGPVDGHDTENLITLLRVARDMKRPVLLHVMTQKGRGYAPALEQPAKFHGIGKFDPATGCTLTEPVESFSDVFGRTMIELAQKDSRVCAVTAAMPGGTGLLNFKEMFPKRIFDVGIAEEHAVSMAGGLAKQGIIPVVAIYSTFLQRSYDMIMQDVAMLGLHVVFAIDRAGLVGEDGETHHGVFDLGFLRQIPGIKILCPSSKKELTAMLEWAVLRQSGPVAIRYPRGSDRDYADSAWKNDEATKTDGMLTCHRRGKDITLITYGSMLKNVTDAAEILFKQGIEATIVRLLTASPLPVSKILENMSENHVALVIEETCSGSGIKEAIASQLTKLCPDCQVDGIDLGNHFVTHGSLNDLYKHHGLDGESIAKYAREVLGR